jgi:hypothetical protein
MKTRAGRKGLSLGAMGLGWAQLLTAQFLGLEMSHTHLCRWAPGSM